MLICTKRLNVNLISSTMTNNNKITCHMMIIKLDLMSFFSSPNSLIRDK